MADDADQPELPKPGPTHDDSPFIAEDRMWAADLPAHHHHVLWQIEGFMPWESVITNLDGGPLEAYQLAGFRSTRLGGAHRADFALHRVLTNILGSIALVSGHIEIEMKRILLTAKAEPESGFADVDLTWKGLEDALAKVASQDNALAKKLKPVLEWGASKNVRLRRNEAIHTAWSLHELGHIEGARLAYKSDGHTVMDRDGNLAATVGILWNYHNLLQTVVRWPTSVLPPLADDAPIRTVEVEGSDSQSAQQSWTDGGLE